MICSLGHDDIQFFIADKNERFKLLERIYGEKIEVCSKIWFPTKMVISTHKFGIKEHQIKIEYEHEINIDYFDYFELSKIHGIDTVIIWEIKPELIEFGDTLRQIKRYERINTFNL